MRVEIIFHLASLDELILFVVRRGIGFQMHATASEIPRCKHNLEMVAILAGAMQWSEQRGENNIIDRYSKPPDLCVPRAPPSRVRARASSPRRGAR
jgi:hypothetical protein